MANEVAVINENTSNAIALAIGGNIDKEKLDALNNIIDKIGVLSGAVDSDTRENGLKYIDDWEDLVLRRISYKVQKLTELRNYFSGTQRDIIMCKLNDAITYCDYNILDTFVTHEFFKNDVIINVVSTVIDPDNENGYLEAFNEISDDVNELIEWAEDNKPEKEFIDNNNMTPSEITGIHLAYDAAFNIFNSQASKKGVALKKKISNIFRSLQRNKNTKEFLKNVTKQIDGMKDIKAIAQEKASLAKMNMIIPNMDLRECLKELSMFQRTL